MRNTKISPMMGRSVRMIDGEFSWNDQYLDEEHNDLKEVERCHEYDVRRETGYWHARSMFLRSYHFSEDKEGWKKMLKKKVKDINRKARLILLDMRPEGLVRRKFGVKVVVVKVEFPMASGPFRFFVPIPTIRKKVE